MSADGTTDAGGRSAVGDLSAPPPTLRRDLEAVLMVVDQPVSEYELARALDVPLDVVSRTLEDLSREYTEQGRGFDLRAVAEGWRVYTRPECADVVEHFLKEGQEVRLTQAALETMAVVAYRQPVSRGRVSAVRGVNCDGVMRTLVLRGLIEEAGHDPESGALLYRTTSYFLERLGLRGLDELPDLAPFLPDDIEGLDDTGEHT
jgi:segregation and condensation protein B